MVVKLQHKSLDLRITPAYGKRAWARALEDCWVGVDGHGYLGFLASFEFDGSSIPPPAWWLIGAPLEWPWCYCGGIHDAAYEGRLLRRFDAGQPPQPVWLEPAFAHALFREMAIAGGMLQREESDRPAVVRRGWAAWSAVRAYGAAWGERKNYLPLEAWRRINPTGSVIAN
jgi:hypothetical protein